MAKKLYTANTPLILQDEAGQDYRVEAGQVLALTLEQYQDVAAHVTPVQGEEGSVSAEPVEENTQETPAEEQQDTPAPAAGRRKKA